MTRQQREFCAFFEKEYEDRITDMCLGKLICTERQSIPSELEFSAGGKDLWGLLIVGEKAVHFYAHASESAIASMFRSASGGREPRSHYAKILYESLEAIEVPQVKKGFWSRLFMQDYRVAFFYVNAEGRRLRLEVAISEADTELAGYLRVKAAEILVKNSRP